MPVLDAPIQALDAVTPQEVRGTVVDVQGLALRVAALPAPVGATVTIVPSHGGQAVPGEVIGVDGRATIVMPLGDTTGIGPGDRVIVESMRRQVRAGQSLIGRVLDGLGRPIDGKGPLYDTAARPLSPPPVDPLRRPCIDEPLATGIRAIDAMTPLGRGQRVGVFAQPGVGKSTLLAQCARRTSADVSVVALVGERGREVRDFIDKTLGPEGLAKSVVVVATSDQPALMRVRAAMVAAAVAEQFRDDGLDVLLLMDSVTRFAQAQRQIGLAAGEPPATRGFPPSVFAMLPTLLERAGRTTSGSITGLYAVLVEGDEDLDPVADTCRGVLDGHISLSRRLAERGHYPAIDVLGSISRVADDVTDADHQAARREVVRLLAALRQVEDLLDIGAYAPGSNPEADRAIAARPAIEQLLRQGTREPNAGDFATTRAQLLALHQHLQQLPTQTANPRRRA